MSKIAFFCNDKLMFNEVFNAGRKEKIEKMAEIYPALITSENFEEHAGHLKDLEIIFSTWGMPFLSEKELDKLPELRAVFYAAGSVKGFAQPLLKKNITVVSAWTANAVPVAEFTVAQILLATKGYYKNIRESKSFQGRKNHPPFRGKGNFGEIIALIGCGAIARKLIELLKNFELKIIVHDPCLKQEEAAWLGVEKVSLEHAFSKAYVVSNHVPNLPSLKGMFNLSLFEKMRKHATFINTARGTQVMEKDLIAVLKKRPDLTALLDVTDPEPPERESELYTLPNVYLTSHIAGSLGDEMVRPADYCIEEFLRWKAGQPLRYAVTMEMLKIMA